MEMLDGTEVVRAVDAPGAMPEAEDMVGAGADAGARAEAGGGLVAEAVGGGRRGWLGWVGRRRLGGRH